MMAACVEKRWTIFQSIPTVAMVKRKHDSTGADSNTSAKKTAKSQNDVHANFGDKLFDNNVVTKYREDYAKSGPYVASCFSEASYSHHTVTYTRSSLA
jgi:hypothetical protein